MDEEKYCSSCMETIVNHESGFCSDCYDAMTNVEYDDVDLEALLTEFDDEDEK